MSSRACCCWSEDSRFTISFLTIFGSSHFLFALQVFFWFKGHLSVMWPQVDWFQFCWHSSLVIKVTFYAQNNVSMMWKSLYYRSWYQNWVNPYRLFNHVTFSPGCPPPPVYLHTVSNQDLNGEDLGTKVMLIMKKSQHWHVIPIWAPILKNILLKTLSTDLNW